MKALYRNRVNKIECGSYTGYYWMSDQQRPELVDGNLPEALSNLDNSYNPFVVEAQLYSEDSGLSYSLKYIDGEYYIFETQVNAADIDSAKKGSTTEIPYKEYYAHRLGGRKLGFLQYWEETEDEFCENMKVLQPAQLAFVGFVNE